MDLLTLLPKLFTAFPFGIGALVLGILYFKRSQRFFFKDYQGNSRARFMDILFGSVFLGLAVGCVLTTLYILREDDFEWGLIPLMFVLGAVPIPIVIAGSYWRSYISNKLWGGFMPMARAFYAQPQVQSAQQIQIDPARIKIPKKTMITAFIIAIFIFAGVFILFGFVEWNINVWLGIIIRIILSGLPAFGVFMLIVSSSLSRRVQKLRDGETIDDEYDF